ncbi:MAG TPA: hypothetical protein VF259_01715 [Solirubrobacterales bacterium]
MSEHRRVPEPGELVYAPRSSWLPAFFAFALALAVCGIFAPFMVPGWVYSVIGIVVALLVFRQMIRGAIRDYYRLPRKQRVRGAVLPVETISPPKR